MRKILRIILDFFELIKINLTNLLDKIAIPAVKVVNVIDQYIRNPSLDIIVALTATKADDTVLNALRAVLPKIKEYLNLLVDFDDCLKLDTNADIIKCLGDIINKIDPMLRPQAYQFISRQIIKHLAANYETPQTISNSDANLVIETAYKGLERKGYFGNESAVA